MTAVIGLGSNLAQPLQQLRKACEYLKLENLLINAYSDIYLSRALVPEKAPQDWCNKPYLNAAVKITTDLTPHELLAKLKKIEMLMGRSSKERWAPRIIDLDILVFDDVILASDDLNLPHQELHQRAFALLPLWDVLPDYRHPHFPELTAKTLALTNIKKLPHPLHGAQIMGIVNVTPDSFSDGGHFFAADAAIAHAEQLFNEGADIIDIGAESTRPGAELLDVETEWQRLLPILKGVQKLWGKAEHRPLISIDTRHAEIVRRALLLNAIDWINDVSQDAWDEMRVILQNSSLKYVAMHHLGVPPNKDKILTEDPFKVLNHYKKLWQDKFTQAGLALDRLILDPGLGFGKSVMQQLAIISEFKQLECDVAWLVGHSRKSFLKDIFLSQDNLIKDVVSAIVSAHLNHKSVQYLRVHAPKASLAAMRLQRFLSPT